MGNRAGGVAWKKFYCQVCGHVEWVTVDGELDSDYACPLCGARRTAMKSLDDPKLGRFRLGSRELAPRVWAAWREPAFSMGFQHFSYILEHPRGVVLFDAPPIPPASGEELIRSHGEPGFLVVSHRDFVGFAQDWADLLEVPLWFGKGEEPIAGNRLEPAQRIASPARIFDDLEVVPVPGHSPGSLALYWEGAPGGPVLLAGDALCAWEHDDRVQLAFFQSKPLGEVVKTLIRRPLSLLCTCVGGLARSGRRLSRAPGHTR